MRRRRSRTRHKRCLANIARLEHELFPEWFPAPQKIEWLDEPQALSLAPGAVWYVDDPLSVQRGLAASAELARLYLADRRKGVDPINN